MKPKSLRKRRSLQISLSLQVIAPFQPISHCSFRGRHWPQQSLAFCSLCFRGAFSSVGEPHTALESQTLQRAEGADSLLLAFLYIPAHSHSLSEKPNHSVSFVPSLSAPWTHLLPWDVSAKHLEPRYEGNALTRCVPMPVTLNFQMLVFKKIAISPASQQQGE